MGEGWVRGFHGGFPRRSASTLATTCGSVCQERSRSCRFSGRDKLVFAAAASRGRKVPPPQSWGPSQSIRRRGRRRQAHTQTRLSFSRGPRHRAPRTRFFLRARRRLTDTPQAAGGDAERGSPHTPAVPCASRASRKRGNFLFFSLSSPTAREGRPCPEIVASPVAREGENNTRCVRSAPAIFGAYRAKGDEEGGQREEEGGIFPTRWRAPLKKSLS